MSKDKCKCGNKKTKVSKMCQKCYLTLRNPVTYRKGEDNFLWRGGRKYTKFGYVMILKPEHPRAKHNRGYVFEHILVVEKKLGRYLKYPQEVVHHVNGIKTDNREENLIVLTQIQHDRKHTKERKRDNTGRFVLSGRNYR